MENKRDIIVKEIKHIIDGVLWSSVFMEQYKVTGMSCAACSARVEKAVSKVTGVENCAVSLLTNTMSVEGTAPEQEIIKAVENAGYGASRKGAAAKAGPSDDDFLKDTETPRLIRRLIRFPWGT